MKNVSIFLLFQFVCLNLYLHDFSTHILLEVAIVHTSTADTGNEITLVSRPYVIMYLWRYFLSNLNGKGAIYIHISVIMQVLLLIGRMKVYADVFICWMLFTHQLLQTLFWIIHNCVKIIAAWLPRQQKVSPQKREAKLKLHNDCQH